MNLRFFAIAAAGMLLMAADKTDDANKKDLERIQGTWNVENGKFDGEEMTVDKLPVQTIAINSDKGTVKISSDSTHQCVIKLDAGKKPPVIRLIDVDDKNLVRGEAIYELDGNTLKLALYIAKKDVPTELTSKPGSGTFLLILKREKK
jgi:uncharacterized protein (TIGR03067 family)